ncbi:hypothetical protein GPECTOR_47g330 [Gonium pectorale]|uniref:EF-hand domain-containing protein n=1 Tax=Gonium pectorale TaxID=33097 RepID=A0A150G926_GONPE|nr:hypothetical protein GPECTOR_47g330 [Gonium pectorale]|eukprot:KXZ46055.1 hypothetical protein GPECTOR_47g330 [Gonium pectorale]
MGAGLAGLVSSASGARAATPLLSELTRPLAIAIDADGDGFLDVDEIRGAMQRTSGVSVPRETVVRDVMAVVDFDDDANVSVDEFARGMALELQVDERWMRHMERDGGAGISAEELAEGLGNLGQQGPEVMRVAFRMSDLNRDGRLNQEEAGHAMRLIASGVLGDPYDSETGL